MSANHPTNAIAPYLAQHQNPPFVKACPIARQQLRIDKSCLSGHDAVADVAPNNAPHIRHPGAGRGP